MRFAPLGTETGTTTRTLTIRNSNLGILNIGVDLSGIAPPFKAAGGGQFSLDHNQRTDVVVQFAPTSQGRFMGSIGISSSDPNTHFVSVSVIGKGVAGRLQAPKTLAFGRVKVGKTRTMTFAITNLAAGILHGSVDGASITNASFSVVSGSGGFALNRRKTQKVKVQFAPASAGRVSAALTITSDDPSRGSVQVILTGAGG